MKNLKYFVGLVIVSAALMFADSKTLLAPAPVDYYLREIKADTITTTESDTINFPVSFLGSWLPVFKFETTQLSGTQNLSVVFQESHKTSGNTDWFAVGSAVTTSGQPIAIFSAMQVLQLRSPLVYAFALLLPEQAHKAPGIPGDW